MSTKKKSFLKSFFTIINWQTFVVLTLSIGATCFCRHNGYIASFPLTLVGISVVFPLVFSINSAYKRRETALKHYAVLKGNGRAIFFASRDWIESPTDDNKNHLKDTLGKLFNSINLYLHTEDQEHDDSEQVVLDSFRSMSVAIKGFRSQGMSGSEVSRSNQYLSKMMISFEELKHIYQYRTPLTLRAYSKIFIYVIPVVYGPYFAEVTIDNPMWMMFILPILFSVLLVSLDNIQEHLENPFDKLGQDDVSINSEKFIDGL
jgi:predicted membrane chloride channel (bestrophin family)